MTCPSASIIPHRLVQELRSGQYNFFCIYRLPDHLFNFYHFLNSVAGSSLTSGSHLLITPPGQTLPVLPTQPPFKSIHSVSTYYRCAVTRSGGGTGFSASLQVLATPPSGCYCTSTATSSADEDIFNVTVGTLNNTSSCATTGTGCGIRSKPLL